MAKAITHKKVTTETIKLKGILTADATTIVVVENDVEKEIPVLNYLTMFSGQAVELTFTNKIEEEIIDEDVEAYDEIDIDELSPEE